MKGKLKVWHTPQVPMEPFFVPVNSIGEAVKILDVLADYDCFQAENNIKPDYSNAQGLTVLDNGEWVEWESDDGLYIHDYAEQLTEGK